eukprot:18146_4
MPRRTRGSSTRPPLRANQCGRQLGPSPWRFPAPRRTKSSLLMLRRSRRGPWRWQRVPTCPAIRRLSSSSRRRASSLPQAKP